MNLRSLFSILRRNPALCVAIGIPLLSLVVSSTLLTFSMSAARSQVHIPDAAPAALQPLSKTSWREGSQKSVENSATPGAQP